MVRCARSGCSQPDAPSMDVESERDLVGRDGVHGSLGVTHMCHQGTLVHLFLYTSHFVIVDRSHRHLLTGPWLFLQHHLTFVSVDD